MLFWILAAVMTAGVLALIMTPLLKPQADGGARASYDLEVYRDQLEELDRDLARGVINEAQAAAARAEIGRRMLASADEGAAPASAGPRAATLVAGVLAVGIPLGALAVYLPLGNPDAPAQPLASRNLEQEQNLPPESVVTAMENLRQQLEQNPDDPQGWSILGQALAKMGHLPQASEALARAVALSPDDTELLGSYAEVATAANGGTVTEDARKAYDRVLEKTPNDPRARFYAGLARFQAGELNEALERWTRLMSESPADAPWVAVLRDYIRQAAEGLGRDPDGAVPQPLPPVARNQQPGAGTPPGDAGQNAPQNAPQNAEDRDRMIRDMVAGLAARLESDPSDVEGWLRLVRSYSVLGDLEKAAEAGRRAREQAPDRPDVLVAYATSLLAQQARDAQGNEAARRVPEEAVGALKQALSLDPGNREALWLLGLEAAGAGRTGEASELWTRLLAQFKPGDPEHATIRARIDQLKAGG
ncbi:c-type cytochrome biogenesis protein CcmI [Azospirillum sp. SYSU D00513]|uniref:c-type cytochrome biogenesis protein CcmI n=1 Tax=Azospirillum sp. SYSU D00513 TaxID=2812561 RepID=UPI001A972A56|nr:c-type cytochrome biogenesis protein CcmI [Azospirillum sp. SYSU D00513]